MAVLSDAMRVADTRALAAAQPDNLFSICFRVTCCHKVTHFSTDLPQLSTYVIYYLNKVLRCEGRLVRSVNFLLTDTVSICLHCTLHCMWHISFLLYSRATSKLICMEETENRNQGSRFLLEMVYKIYSFAQIFIYM